MKGFQWDKEKNELLKSTRWLSFEMVVEAINSWKLLDEIAHPNTIKFPHQRMFIVDIEGYACDIPYVVTEENNLFLKTIIPNRKHNKKYLQ